MRKGELEIFLPELIELEKLHERVDRYGRVRKELVVPYRGYELPVYSYAFGPDRPGVPTLILVGGVHGLERIGTRVVTSYLVTWLELLDWDRLTAEAAAHLRVVFYPLVNPGGMMATTRSNPRGVDLMRNAPVDMERPSIWRLFEGHRMSKRLPWYRGARGQGLEPEAKALCEFIEREAWRASTCLSVDVHSGFGSVDRLWFPYAKSSRPIARLAEAYRLKELLDRTYPNHVYRVEPQSHQYRTHGDLWDYLFDRHEAERPDHVFLPLSLEMGSWMWVKKNPRQLFSILGAFNPVIPHRKQRTLRRHLMLFDFLVRAALGAARWAQVGDGDRNAVHERAVGHWYGR